MELPSTKPYLIRAIWEWCCDNGFTPYLSVVPDAHTVVPREHVREGQIVLNIGPDATNRLQIGNDVIQFAARFGGVARELSVPVGRVAAIYARENGAGMAFELDTEVSAGDAPEASAVSPDPSPLVGVSLAEGGRQDSKPVKGDPGEEGGKGDDEPPPRPEGGRPRLQRIK